MANTDITTNFEPCLEKGEAKEQVFLNFLNLFDRNAYKVLGNCKETDFVSPKYGLMELKYDEMSDITDNLAFEIKFRGNWSGISSTKAEVWISADSRKFYCFSVKKLREFLKANWKGLTQKPGGDGNEAVLVLVGKNDMTSQGFCSSFLQDGSDLEKFCSFLMHYREL